MACRSSIEAVTCTGAAFLITIAGYGVRDEIGVEFFGAIAHLPTDPDPVRTTAIAAHMLELCDGDTQYLGDIGCSKK